MLEHDAGILRGDDREILLSFATDPYSPEELTTGLTRQAIEILIDNGLRFTVLTKGGTRASRDFDLLDKYEKCSFGTTLVFASQQDADYWEPRAASIADRIETLKTAHQRGIRTWCA
jgi:DNA repair photolyase